MSAGEQSFRLAQKHADDATAALDAGNLEEATVRAQLADAHSRLALAAAVVLTTNSDQAGTYRMAVGRLGL